MNSRFRTQRDLLLLLALSFLLMSTIYVWQAPSIRLALGLVYVLVFPGYALVAALFPGRDDLVGIERVTFSFILSMALVSLIGLGLSWTAWGVRLEPILVSVTSFIVLASGVAYRRRMRLPLERRLVVRLELDLPNWQVMPRLDRILGAALALSILFAGSTVLYFLVNPKVSERYTEFYVLGPSGKFEGYPAEIAVDEPITLVVGVINREHADAQYRVVKDVNGQELEEIAEMQLAHGEKLEQLFTFTLRELGENQKVSLLLYREGQEEPYRSLHLWITVLPGHQWSASPTPSPAEQ